MGEAFGSCQRGLGRAKSPRIPSRPTSAAASSEVKDAADQPPPPRKPKPSPSKKQPAVRKAADWWPTVAAAEASAINPPPCDNGTTPEGRAWLEANAAKPLVENRLPCGLQFMELKRGKPGAKSPLATTPCEVHYHGFLLDGTEVQGSGLELGLR